MDERWRFFSEFNHLRERRLWIAARKLFPLVHPFECLAAASPRRDHVVIHDRVLETEVSRSHAIRPHISEYVVVHFQHGGHVPAGSATSCAKMREWACEGG